MVRHLTYFCLLLLLSSAVCSAQSAQDTSAQTNAQASQTGQKDASASAAASTDKNKKVWTNEDLKAAGSVSVIGDPKNQKYTMTKPPDPATVTKYRNALQKLQEQLADVNRQLKAYGDFTEGKPVSEGGRDLSHGYSRTPIDQQVAKLHDKKKQLEDQIDALYEESRKKGIESGMLK